MVRRAIDRPGDVVGRHKAHENTANDPRPSAQRQQQEAKPDLPPNERLVEEDVKPVLGEIRSKPQLFRFRQAGVVVAVHPLHVRPKEPAIDVVRVAFTIRVRVMLAVRRDPIDRTALERKRSQNRYAVFERLYELEAAMCQKPVKAQRDAEGAGQIIERYGCEERAPRKHVGQKYRESGYVDDAEPDARSDEVAR